MILICPDCSTRYLLSASAIGEEGRNVRCAKCDHEWFQESEEDENKSLADDLDSLTDSVEEEQPPLEEEAIPDAVKPIPEGSNVPAFAADVIARKVGMKAHLISSGAALLVFIAFLAGGVVFKQQVASFWPPAIAMYEVAGIPVKFEGEGLLMQSLSSTIFKDDHERDILVLKGRVINMTDHAIDVPKMIATLRSTNGKDGEGWIINAPVDQVAPSASFAFISTYPAVPRGVGSVNLTFLPVLMGVKSQKIAHAEISKDEDAAADMHDDKADEEKTPRSPVEKDPPEHKSEEGHAKDNADHHESKDAGHHAPAH